ncbi:MAG: hypothetical protein RLZZ15_341, partial [Verrucomicrobiota bacterium]
LRAAVATHPPAAPGDLVFALDAAGTGYDVFLRLGATSYLVCNHTDRALAKIREHPGWLGAQAVLFELGEKFRADPLVEEKAEGP